MRELLTYIGIGLIVLLTAALAAPYVIDFDAHRARIAEEVASASGAQVSLNGPLSLRLLPTPRIAAQDVEASGAVGSLRAKSLLLELSLPALTGGRLQFTQARCEDCDISIETAKPIAANAAALQFDQLVLRGARIALLRNGESGLLVEKLDLSANAPALVGPWRGQGAFSVRGERIAFSFAADALEKKIMPIKASLTAAGETGRLDLEGRLEFAGEPRFEGQGKASGKAPPGPWQAEAQVSADFGGAEARNVSAVLGEGTLAAKIIGAGRIQAKTKKISLDLTASRIDQAWTAYFASPLLAAGASARTIDLRLRADSLDWAGASFSQVEVSRQTGGPLTLRGNGPGGSHIDVAAVADKDFWRGKGSMKIADYAGFAASMPEVASLARLTTGAVEIGGDFTLSAEEFVLSRGNLALDRAHFQGDLRFNPRSGERRASFVAHLAAPALNIDAAPDVADALPDDVDLDLALEAQTVRLARNGQKLGEAGHVRAHFLRDGDGSRLEKLDVQKVGGADMTASAAWGRDFAGLKGEARLKGADMTELAQFLAKLVPGAITKAIASRGKAFSPVDLVARASADTGFSLNGALGGAKIAASLAPAAGGIWGAAFDLAAPDGGILLGQLGAPLLSAQKLGPAHVSAKTEAAPDGKLAVIASADLAGAHGEFHGAVADFAGSPAVAGELTLNGDFSKMLSGFGVTAAPARLVAKLEQRDGAIRLRDMAGEWGANRFVGDASMGADGIVGSLRCDRLQASSLAALVLGAPAPAKPGALWPSLSFAPVVTDPPRVKELSVETDELQPFGGKARFKLALGPGLLSASEVKIETDGGQLSGRLDLRREGGQVTVSGDAEVERLMAKDKAMSAAFGGKLHFAGNGASLAALVGSLAGAGEIHADSLNVSGAAEDGPDEALAASEANEAPFDTAAAMKSLDGFLARGDFKLAQASLSARLADGKLQLSGQEGAEPKLELAYDLRDATMALTLSIAAQKAPAGWTATLPRAEVVWSGPWSAPARRVESTSFVNAVATRALERELARVEAMKARDRERLRALAPPTPNPGWTTQ
jgi:hypothetical protein